MSTARRMWLALVPNQHDDHTTDDCMVEVIADARGGSARSLVRCLYTREIHRVHPGAVRPLAG